MYSVTIDTGTTNTRVFVWQDNRIIAEASQAVGVRDTAITGTGGVIARGQGDLPVCGHDHLQCRPA